MRFGLLRQLQSVFYVDTVRVEFPAMSRVVKRSASQAVKPVGLSEMLLFRASSLRTFPSWSRSLRRGLNGCAKSNFDGFPMAACIEDGQVQLLTGTCLDWTDKYPSRYRLRT